MYYSPSLLNYFLCPLCDSPNKTMFCDMQIIIYDMQIVIAMSSFLARQYKCTRRAIAPPQASEWTKC